MQKWEYKVISDWPTEHTLKPLGLEGWEIVGIAVENNEFGCQRMWVYLKRPLSS